MFDAILGEGTMKRIRENTTHFIQRNEDGISYANILKEPLFKSKSGNQKTMSNPDFENGLDFLVNDIVKQTQNDLSNQNEAEDDFLQVNEEFINFDRAKRKQKEEDDFEEEF